MSTNAGALFYKTVLLAAVFLSLSYFARADAGFASYYTDTVPSACYGFDQGQFPADGFWAAATDGALGAPVDLYRNGQACGKRYTVRCTGLINETPGAFCTGRSVSVKIIDRCPQGCGITIRGFGAQFDLSQAAFLAIVSTTDAGVIKIDYEADNSDELVDPESVASS